MSVVVCWETLIFCFTHRYKNSMFFKIFIIRLLIDHYFGKTLCCTLSNRFFFSKYLYSHSTNDSHLSFSRITALLIMQSSNGTTHAWPRREFAQKLQWAGFLYTLVSRLRLIISRRKFLSVIMFLRRLRLRSRQLSWLWTAALFSQRLIHCVKAQLRRRRRRQL